MEESKHSSNQNADDKWLLISFTAILLLFFMSIPSMLKQEKQEMEKERQNVNNRVSFVTK